MPVDIYYTPNEGAAPVTLDDLRQRFSAAGISYVIEPDSDAPDMQWMVFEPQSETTICLSIKGENVVFATVAASFNDDPAFGEKLDHILESAGLSAEEQY